MDGWIRVGATIYGVVVTAEVKEAVLIYASARSG